MILIFRLLFKTCKKTAALIDKQSFTPLTIFDKIQLRGHKTVCKTCKSYQSQSFLIDAVLGKWFAFESNQQPSTLDEKKKNKIIEQIKRL